LAGCNTCNSLHETNGKYENLNSINSQLYYHHATYYSCSYVFNSIHEYFVETDLHLQISQHQARLKHENFTVSYHSYPTLLPQNILQQQLHYSCTLCSINNLRFTKIRVSGNGELLLHVLGFKMFLALPKFEWSCFSWSNFDLGCCNLQFAQIFVIYANLNDTFPICPDFSNCTQVWMKLFHLPKHEFAQIFLSVCNFKWSGCILFKLDWRCLNVPKIEWRFSTWPEAEWNYCCLVRVDLVWWNLPKFFQFMETFLTSTKFEWSCPNLLKFHYDC